MTNTHSNNYPLSDRLSYLWLIIGTALMVFIYGNWPLSLAGWLAPMFLIRFTRTQKPLRGLILVTAGLAVANMFAFQKGAAIAIIPLPIFSIVIAIQIGLLFLIDRILVPRLPSQGIGSFLATLVFPLLVTTQEFLLYNKIMFGSSGSWAYTQSSNLVLIQLISITGLWGLTFIMTWFASTFNWVWEQDFSWPKVKRGVTIFSSILILVLVFGAIRLRFFDTPAGTVRVHGFVAFDYEAETYIPQLGDLRETDYGAFREQMADIYDQLIEGTIQEARAGAEIVVWSEVAAIGSQADIDALIVQSQQVAQEENIYLITSVLIWEDEVYEPRAIVIDPMGKIVINHLKYAYGMGTPISEVDLQTVDTPYGRLSVVLCSDLDNPGVVSQAGRKGVDIILVPAQEDNKPYQGSWHFRLAPFRAVENGFSLVRIAGGGTSIATDPYGRVLASVNSLGADELIMVAQVPTTRVQTIYAAVGNLFGWLVLAGFVSITGWAIYRGRKTRMTDDAPSAVHTSAG